MILCEREIQALVKRKLVVIEGCPEPDSKRWSSTALDLTLHDVILEWDVTGAPPTGGAAGEVRPFSDTFNVQQMMDDERYAKKVTIPSGDGYPLAPGGFILGFTVEKVSIPHDCRIAARVEGKSSLAHRLGRWHHGPHHPCRVWRRSGQAHPSHPARNLQPGAVENLPPGRECASAS